MGTYAFIEETTRKTEVEPSGSLGIIGNTTWGGHKTWGSLLFGIPHGVTAQKAHSYCNRRNLVKKTGPPAIVTAVTGPPAVTGV